MASAISSGILKLPNELLIQVAENLPSHVDMNSLIRVNRRMSMVLRTPFLLYNIRHCKSSAIFWAVYDNDVQMANRLVKLGADISSPRPFPDNPVNPDSNRFADKIPLHYAVQQGRLLIVAILLAAKVDATVRHDGQTPLATAIAAKNAPIARALISQTKDLEASINEEGKTALQMAIEARLVDTVQYLVERGAVITFKDEHAWIVNGLLQDLDYWTEGKLKDAAITILGILIMYRAEFPEKLHALGRAHSDARIRQLFVKANMMALQESYRGISVLA
ncbi:ankyrin [Corynespora cassiicola Philippines]|uniref:Ankyrin n=1 Tax=Corynespora cassiicola Philippines TaxID=1448308 RepID=A0A2T2N959_CORCC|nr:ankyrin [Corynespora cassiicola Philippines]